MHGPTRGQRLPNREPLHNAAAFAKHDINRDGCLDLVMVWMGVRVSRQAPLVYRNNGSGQFRPMSPEPFLRADMYVDEVMPADVNGDGVTDIMNLEYNEGPDRLVGTRDDYGVFVTLLNTTWPRPIRCGG